METDGATCFININALQWQKKLKQKNKWVWLKGWDAAHTGAEITITAQICTAVLIYYFTHFPYNICWYLNFFVSIFYFTLAVLAHLSFFFYIFIHFYVQCCKDRFLVCENLLANKSDSDSNVNLKGSNVTDNPTNHAKQLKVGRTWTSLSLSCSFFYRHTII